VLLAFRVSFFSSYFPERTSSSPLYLVRRQAFLPMVFARDDRIWFPFLSLKYLMVLSARATRPVSKLSRHSRDPHCRSGLMSRPSLFLRNCRLRSVSFFLLLLLPRLRLLGRRSFLLCDPMFPPVICLTTAALTCASLTPGSASSGRMSSARHMCGPKRRPQFRH